jgi:hypothetical protein
MSTSDPMMVFQLVLEKNVIIGIITPSNISLATQPYTSKASHKLTSGMGNYTPACRFASLRERNPLSGPLEDSEDCEYRIYQ